MSKNLLPTEIVRLYRVWTSMVYRCTKPQNKQYKNYGGRGINICQDWMDFNKFCEDVGQRTGENYHLDRIDNDKGYYKENCRWVSPKENHRNKRNNKYFHTHLGKICKSEFIETIGYTKKQFERAIEKYGEKKFLELYEQGNLPQKKVVPNLNDIINKKFGKLLVTQLDHTSKVGTRYFCICDCGKNTRISRFKLMHGKAIHCEACSIRGDLNPKRKKLKQM